jgi:hypothetical protein
MLPKMAYNGGDWRSKSLALRLMFSTTLDGFYFANCVLAVRAVNVMQLTEVGDYEAQNFK